MAYVAFVGLAIVGDDREAVEAARSIAVDSADGLHRAHIGISATEVTGEDSASAFAARMQSLGLRVGRSKLIREWCGLDPLSPTKADRVIADAAVNAQPCRRRVVFVREMETIGSPVDPRGEIWPGRCWFTVDGERCDDLATVRRIAEADGGADTDYALLESCIALVEHGYRFTWPTVRGDVDR